MVSLLRSICPSVTPELLAVSTDHSMEQQYSNSKGKLLSVSITDQWSESVPTAKCKKPVEQWSYGCYHINK